MPRRLEVPRHDPADRPRERLDSLGPEALSDAELVALLLRTGSRGRDALSVASGLLRRHGGDRSLSFSLRIDGLFKGPVAQPGEPVS